MSLPKLLVYLAVGTVCRNNMTGGIDPGIFGQTCTTEVKTFDDKESLGEYLKTVYRPYVVCSDGPCVDVYVATPVKYEVKIKTKEQRKETTETVETGREVIFK
jgi:hypothetical protein